MDHADDPARRTAEARRAIDALRATCESYLQQREAEDRVAKAKVERDTTLKSTIDREQSYDDLRSVFGQIAKMTDRQKRGYALERFMYKLFDLEGLTPKPSFRIDGEQLDGSFTLIDTDFIFEAKWTASVTKDDLVLFDNKIGKKLDNTLGLFLSIEGFTVPNLNQIWAHRPKMILMEGQDLMAVLERRLTLAELAGGKKRHAADTGEIYCPVARLLA
jgi:hypothetical protein